MAYVTGLRPKELERIQWCQGCRWLSVAGEHGCCDYIFYHDHRRPCAFGKGCTVKELGTIRKNWKLSPKSDGPIIERSRPKIRKVWNTRLARRLYEQGLLLDEICRRVGISRSRLCKEAKTYGWVRQAPLQRQKPTNTPRWDVETARRLYEEEGVKPPALAEMFNVYPSTVRHYANKHGWKKKRKEGGEE